MSTPPKKLSAFFTLYYGPYSMYSTMVRTTFALRGPVHADGRPEMLLQPQVINIYPGAAEQLSEDYLGTVNRNATVPVLANDALFPKSLVESTSISWYIADWYPRLLPPEYETEIRELVSELHQINASILTMGVNGKLYELLLAKTRDLLGQDGLSERYHALLKGKEEHLEQRVGNMTTESMDEAIALTKMFLPKVQTLLDKNGTGADKDFLFGSHPTVLDAHVLVFLCRLCDVNRAVLIPPTLLAWVKRFRNSNIWNQIVPDGTTLPPRMM